MNDKQGWQYGQYAFILWNESGVKKHTHKDIYSRNTFLFLNLRVDRSDSCVIFLRRADSAVTEEDVEHEPPWRFISSPPRASHLASYLG